MSTPIVTQIEQAIVAELKASLPYLAICETMNITLRGEAEKSAFNTPAVFVLYTSGKPGLYTAGAREKKLVFSALIVVKNLRGDEGARHGDSVDKGVYDIMKDIEDTLTNNKLDLDIEPLFSTDEGALTGSKSNAIYYINFETRHIKTY